jgi:hypothetical protein
MGLKTIEDVADWCEGVHEELGDPALAVCQLFFRWIDVPRLYAGNDLVCGLEDGSVILRLARGGFVALPVESGDAVMDLSGQVKSFGAIEICPGVWSVEPSLNVPGLFHAFIALYGVPAPAPWEQLIVIARW